MSRLTHKALKAGHFPDVVSPCDMWLIASPHFRKVAERTNRGKTVKHFNPEVRQIINPQARY